MSVRCPHLHSIHLDSDCTSYSWFPVPNIGFSKAHLHNYKGKSCAVWVGFHAHIALYLRPATPEFLGLHHRNTTHQRREARQIQMLLSCQILPFHPSVEQGRRHLGRPTRSSARCYL